METFAKGQTGSEHLTVWSAVAHHQVGGLTLEVTDDLLGRRHLTGRRRHGSCDAPRELSRPMRALSVQTSVQHVKSSRPDLSDVTLDLSDSRQRSHGLQVHRHDLHLLTLLLLPPSACKTTFRKGETNTDRISSFPHR